MAVTDNFRWQLRTGIVINAKTQFLFSFILKLHTAVDGIMPLDCLPLDRLSGLEGAACGLDCGPGLLGSLCC